jgi:outer membrane protein TolC
MLKITLFRLFLGFAGVLLALQAYSQQPVLSLKEAVRIGLENYPSIKAKANQLNASKSYLNETKTEYLPNLNFSAQQDYGTAISQFGPSYGFNGLSVSSAGPTAAKQNWNAAFGALYLTNVNWDFFAFGRAVEKVKVQRSVVNRDTADYSQESFQHEVRVAAAYLNLVAAQRLTKVQQDNLTRTMDLRKVVVTRVKNGLNPGVDSSLANAEVSSAIIALTNAQENEQERANDLSRYMGINPQNFVLDSTFVSKIPNNPDPGTNLQPDQHPILKYYNSLVNVSDEQARYLKTLAYPTFTLFSVFQGRGSGFKNDLAANPLDYTDSYGTGISPSRYNYLVGVGVTWNFTSLFRIHYQVKSQKYTSLTYRDNYDLVSQQLHDQQVLAETRIANSIKNSQEAPVEIKAATDAFNQKSTLYRNGLANITDFTQALYALYRAETDSYVANNNVWQALLFKAAATGDFRIFINNF